MAGVNVEGEAIDAQRAVLWSRFASRVLWPLTEFDCPDEAALYAGARAIDWTAHLDAGMTLAVDAHVSGEGITHARALASLEHFRAALTGSSSESEFRERIENESSITRTLRTRVRLSNSALISGSFRPRRDSAWMREILSRVSSREYRRWPPSV